MLNTDLKFNKIVEKMIEDFVQRHPQLATFIGGKYHMYDAMMDEGSIEENEKDIAALKEVKNRLLALNPEQLSPDHRLDRELLLYFADFTLFQQDELKLWEHVVTAGGGPVGTIGFGLFPLFTRDFAPFESRVRSMIGRMRGSIDFLENTKETWKRPIKLWTEIAIKECASIPGLFMVIGQALQTAGIPEELINEFQAIAAELTKKIQEYQTFLETDILPRATYDWVLGSEDYDKLLQVRKLPYSANEILQMGEQFLKEKKAELEELAKEIHPESKDLAEVRERIKANHPVDFKEVLTEVRNASEAAREFIIDKGLATIADGTSLQIMETPEYMRPLIPFAALVPAELLRKEQESQYLVTPGRDDSFLKEHCYASIYNVAVHEGWPGHHLQISHGNLFGNVIRSLASGTETIEGWAHYCEQMMVEEGFYDNKDFLDNREIKFIQKLDVLFRAVRIILDVKLHTNQISYEDAIEYLIAETGMAREAAVAEVTRYTMAPGYQLSYLIGKHLILELREELKQKLSDKFSLKWFHDVILRTGGIPFYYLKRIYLEKAKELI